MNKRAMPETFMTYKWAIQLQKPYNLNEHSLEWISFNRILTSRQLNFIIMKTNETKRGIFTCSPLPWVFQTFSFYVG